jgi:hypothetical protein
MLSVTLVDMYADIITVHPDHLPEFETVRIVYGMLLCRIQLSYCSCYHMKFLLVVDASHTTFSLHHILHAICYTYIK